MSILKKRRVLPLEMLSSCSSVLPWYCFVHLVSQVLRSWITGEGVSFGSVCTKALLFKMITLKLIRISHCVFLYWEFSENRLESYGKRVWKSSWGTQESTFLYTYSDVSTWGYPWDPIFWSPETTQWKEGGGLSQTTKLEVGGNKEATVGIQCFCLCPPSLFLYRADVFLT